jgi:hypothetical protein
VRSKIGTLSGGVVTTGVLRGRPVNAPRAWRLACPPAKRTHRFFFFQATDAARDTPTKVARDRLLVRQVADLPVSCRSFLTAPER